MTLLPADYAICVFAVVLAVTGLFRGFSGSLAFVFGSIAAIVVGMFAWSYSATFTTEAIVRSLVVLVAALLAFGIVRVIVRKCVNGLLAQPADALLGFAVGFLVAVLVVAALARLGFGLEYSNIVRMASQFVTAQSLAWQPAFGVVCRV